MGVQTLHVHSSGIGDDVGQDEADSDLGLPANNQPKT
jgi:hypothetical protein